MLKIRDPETGDVILQGNVNAYERQYPFEFVLNEKTSDFYLSALEAKTLYEWLGEHFGPQDLTNE